MAVKNKVEEAVNDNKLNKFGVTKKTAYSALSMLGCIMLVIVLSVTQAVFNEEAIKTVAFWIEFAILAGLTIFGMISGQQMGDDMARNNPKGQFRASLKDFLKIATVIMESMLYAYLDEWLEFYRERKLRKKIEAFLKDNGVKQMEVLNLDISEVEKLNMPFKKDWTNTEYAGKYKNDTTSFLTYTQEQINVIKYCLAGKVKVSKLPRTFFVDAFYNSEKDMWESAANQGKKKTSYLSVNYIYKIGALLAVCILTAGLTPGAQDGITAATIWLSLIKRLFCLLTSYVWGIWLGHEIVKIDRSYLDFKTDMLNTYNEECKLGIFKTKSIEEKALEAYEEANVKNEEREKNIPN